MPRGCVELQTIWWLNRTVRALPSVPSLAFVHVPVPEFMEVWNKGLARGSKHEDVNCPMHDSGLFRAAKEMNITAIYSGHDHDNNYEGVLDGVRLAYGHKTGALPASPLVCATCASKSVKPSALLRRLAHIQNSGRG